MKYNSTTKNIVFILAILSGAICALSALAACWASGDVQGRLAATSMVLFFVGMILTMVCSEMD